MYLIYLLLIMLVLQSVLFYVPGLLLIGVVLYAAYSFVQYRRTRKAYSGVGQEPHDSGAQASGSGNSRKMSSTSNIQNMNLKSRRCLLFTCLFCAQRFDRVFAGSDAGRDQAGNGRQQQ